MTNNENEYGSPRTSAVARHLLFFITLLVLGTTSSLSPSELGAVPSPIEFLKSFLMTRYTIGTEWRRLLLPSVFAYYGLASWTWACLKK